jgi:hypothetical protein
MNYKEKILVIIVVVVSSLSFTNIELNAQFMQKKMDYNSAYKIVKDTLWLNQRIWKEAQKMGTGNNPIYKICNNEDAKGFDFVLVPFYKISQKGIDYDFNRDITNFIDLDTTVFWAFVKYQNRIVGYINVLFRNNIWIGSLEVFNDNSPMKFAYERVIEIVPDYMFTIKYLSGLWVKKDNEVKVYSFYNQKINTAIDYLKSTSSIEAIKGYANGKEGGDLP